MTDEALKTFTEHRPLLFSIAYRMLGTVADAEDLIQDTFIRWQSSGHGKIESPRAWLSTVITRLCINHLKSARVQREQYVGPWLPEPLVAGLSVDPAENAKLADSLSLAFLILLENLAPTERAVFVLREVFSYDFEDIALMVEKSETNCRQILARARKHIEQKRPRFEAASEQAEQLIQQFEKTVLTGDLQGLLELLARDVVLVSDGGGKARAVLRPIEGADHVSRLLVGAAQKFGSPDEIRRVAAVNGLPGLVTFENGKAIRVLAFGLRDNRIQSLFIITNPDKLRHLHALLTDNQAGI